MKSKPLPAQPVQLPRRADRWPTRNNGATCSYCLKHRQRQGGVYDQWCQCCVAFAVLAHPLRQRARLIRHWARRYQHNQRDLQAQIINISQQTKGTEKNA
jgi:hypothetical protein